ncbi:MAG: tetratricopeptide repeat protein, partial [Candidatus Omnitrophica bacterium]|nr:tetratricopeptide repeat protein [Candidatus Omnitrophota bacterium]
MIVSLILLSGVFFYKSISRRPDRPVSVSSPLSFAEDNDLDSARQYILNGDYSRAVEHLNKAIAINPRSYEEHLSLGELYQRQGDYSRAVEHLDQSIAI